MPADSSLQCLSPTIPNKTVVSEGEKILSKSNSIFRFWILTGVRRWSWNLIKPATL